MTEESRERFAAEARAQSPDPVLLCLLMGFEADLGGADAAGSLDAGMAPSLNALAKLTALAAADLAAAGCLPGQADRPGGGPPPAQAAALLAGALAGAADLRGGPAAYRRLESSLLHQVLRTGRGLPILLSVVWIHVGRSLGLPVYGVALPGHFVVGVGEPEGEHVLVDPFRGGRPLTREDAEALVAEAGYPLDPEMLRPAEPVDIALRVLTNIRSWAAARPEHARTQLWAAELSLLLPRHPAQLRLERGELLVRTGSFLEGAAEMESYATILDAFDPESAARVRLEARAARHRLN
ncbi:tetratricopeptide repeat protein [Streptacidiphilus sp. PB12-B1b]|uniref:transglutaminase family protein n=1 Tax=Streptacidiphilus sp. PB12-B1b TaxID=2705012 RepID=UPI0015FAA10A|nr:transglutaminase-like domain-containing protein [Streptacidiphilus sp. PB12-B1b]QMU75184.1 tetratricopeptide repeat protein [Streptacidiphilus sp. PB12-B1b]